MVFIGILYISLSKPRLQYESSNIQGNSEQALADLVLYLLVFSFLINDIVEIVRRRGIFCSSFLNLYTLTANEVLFSVGVITFAVHKLNDEAGKSNNRADLPWYNPLNIGVTLIAFRAILHGSLISRWFLLHNRAGPVVISIIRVLKDVIYMFLIWVIVYLSFGLGIWLLYKPFNAVSRTTVYCLDEDVVHDNKHMNGVLSQMFWLVFNGDGHAQRIQHKSALNGVQEFSKEFAHPVGLSFWAMYQGIICILL